MVVEDFVDTARFVDVAVDSVLDFLGSVACVFRQLRCPALA